MDTTENPETGVDGDITGLSGEPIVPEREPLPVFDTVPSKAKKPKYFVAGTTFYAQMDDGWELAAPIKLSTRTVRQLRAIGDDADELDQLVKLFELLGDEQVVERLLDADFIDATEAALRYFQAWEEKNEARLGELLRSSSS